jgi:hypothetical protein
MPDQQGREILFLKRENPFLIAFHGFFDHRQRTAGGDS